MRKILCKIWNFVLMLFGDVVDAVVDAVGEVADLAIDVISIIGDELVDIVDKTADSLGLGNFGKIIIWGGLAYLLFTLLPSKDRKEEENGTYVT